MNNIITTIVNFIPFPANYIIISIGIVLFLYLICPLIGFIINRITDIEFNWLSKLFGEPFALFFINRLTFIGVITHELAHWIFAKICGAYVDKIKLLTFFSDDELGSVRFITQGGIIKQHFQMFFASCGPVIINTTISILLIYNCKDVAHWYIYILIGYLVISLMNHASMSKPDLKIYFNSSKIVIPVLTIILFIGFILLRKV